MAKDVSKSIVLQTDMGNVELDDLIDKALIANGNVKAYQLPNKTAQIVAEYSKGQTIGNIYSWVTVGGNIWFQFYDKNGKAYYVQQNEKFDTDVLKDQGVKTVKQKEEEKKEKENPMSFTDKLAAGFLKFGKAIIIIIIIGLVLYVVVTVYKLYKK